MNRHRGEIAATLDGKPWRLCLTLGALAELEAAFGDADMLALAERFERGRLSAADAVRIIAAGLRGAGHDLTDADVGAMHHERGAAGYVEIVAALLTATFGAEPETVTRRSEPSDPSPSTRSPRKPPPPFPGGA